LNDSIVDHLVTKKSRWMGIFERQLRDKIIEAVKNLDLEAIKFCLSYDFNFNEINNLKIPIICEESKKTNVFDSCNLLHLLFLVKNPLLELQQDIYIKIFSLLIQHGVDFNHQARVDSNSNLIRIRNLVPKEFTELAILVKLYILENKLSFFDNNLHISEEQVEQRIRYFWTGFDDLSRANRSSDLLNEYKKQLYLKNSPNLNTKKPMLPDLFSLSIHESEEDLSESSQKRVTFK